MDPDQRVHLWGLVASSKLPCSSTLAHRQDLLFDDTFGIGSLKGQSSANLRRMGAGSLPRSGISAVYALRPSVCTLPALLRTAEPAATPQRQARRPRRARKNAAAGRHRHSGWICTLKAWPEPANASASGKPSIGKTSERSGFTSTARLRSSARASSKVKRSANEP
jgi:hypothetical protein